MMKKLIIVGLALTSSISAFAGECESGAQYAQETVQYVQASTHSTQAKRNAAAMVGTSCQRDAVFALVDGYMATTPKMMLALEITNSYQAEAFACLAANGIAMVDKYSIALGALTACAAAEICELASLQAARNAPYIAAANCK